MAESPSGRVLEIADGLTVEFVSIAALREQDVNAQIMQPTDMTRLTENIKHRGQIESLPYCYLDPDSDNPRVEIVSGHHRVRAARAAGLTDIPVLVDRKKMRRSELVAKQIAHNHLHGNPDEAILAQLVGMIQDVDDLLMTGLPENWLPVPDKANNDLAVPHADFDWQSVTLAFLPQQAFDFKEALMLIEKNAIVGVARSDQYEPFAKAAHEFGRFASISSIATTINVLTDLAVREAQELEKAGVEPRGKWARTSTIVGHALPPDAAKVVEQAIHQVMHDHQVTPERALELICADYISGLPDPGDPATILTELTEQAEANAQA